MKPNIDTNMCHSTYCKWFGKNRQNHRHIIMSYLNENGHIQTWHHSKWDVYMYLQVLMTKLSVGSSPGTAGVYCISTAYWSLVSRFSALAAPNTTLTTHIVVIISFIAVLQVLRFYGDIVSFTTWHTQHRTLGPQTYVPTKSNTPDMDIRFLWL